MPRTRTPTQRFQISVTPIAQGRQPLKTLTQAKSKRSLRANGLKADADESVTLEEIEQSFELLKYLNSCGTISIKEKNPDLVRIKIQLFLSGLVTTTSTTSGNSGNSETAQIPHASTSKTRKTKTKWSADSFESESPDPDPPQTQIRFVRTLKKKKYSHKRLPEKTEPNTSPSPVQNSLPILSASDLNFENLEDFIKEEPDDDVVAEESLSIPEMMNLDVAPRAEFEGYPEFIIPDSIEDVSNEGSGDEDQDPLPEPDTAAQHNFPENSSKSIPPPPDPVRGPTRQRPRRVRIRIRGKPRVPKTYPCRDVLCGKILHSVRSYREHLRQQHPKLPRPPAPPQSHLCPICGKLLTTKKGLRRHTSIFHSDIPMPRNFLCDRCPKAYDNASKLKDHVVMVHQSHEPPEFLCPVCDKGFHLKVALKRHSAVHSTEAPYKCEFCKRGFRDKKTLRNHVGLHSGVKKYKCEPCGLSFVQIGSLKYHNRRHHGDGASSSASAGAEGEGEGETLPKNE